MTVFKVYHICREHGKGSSKLGKVERASVNVWKCMGGLPKKRKKGDMRDSLEKGKYLANSYNAAAVNVNYKLSSFFQCYFKRGTEILMTVWKFFFPGIIAWEGISYFHEWEVTFSVGDSFVGGEGTP